MLLFTFVEIFRYIIMNFISVLWSVIFKKTHVVYLIQENVKKNTILFNDFLV